MRTKHIFAGKNIFKTLLFLALFATGITTQAFAPKTENPNGAAPTNMALSGQTSTSLSFTWDGVGNPDGFKVWYHRSNDNYTSPPVFTANEYITFSGLTSGIYDVFVVAIHGEEVSSYIVTSDLIME